MWTETAGIIGVGYQGLSLDELGSDLSRRGVTTLVDVRLNPISRKRGFSKKALSEYLAETGINYLHLPSLGNPRENRAGYATHDTEEGREARDRYREVLQEAEALAALRQLATLAQNEHVAVFCYENSELGCHRHEVLRAVHDLIDES